MIIFELPSDLAGRGLRASSLGSCRVRNPIFTLRDRGDLKLCAEGPAVTHSAAEALQTLAVAMGERQIPDALSPYIFETELTPAMHRLSRALADGVDVFIVEVSDDKQFSYGGLYFNQNFVSRYLIQPQRGALLDWYRRVCRGQVVDEDCVQDALDKMRASGLRHDDGMADLLRRVRLDHHTGEEITRSLGDLMAKGGGRWVVIGPLVVPDHDGAIMRHRRDLKQKLEDAATRCGAMFFDPSRLIADHGKSAVLAGDGANIHEYAEAFYPVLGETLVALVRDAGSAVRRRPSALPPRSRSTWRRLTRYFSKRIKAIWRIVRSRPNDDERGLRPR